MVILRQAQDERIQDARISNEHTEQSGHHSEIVNLRRAGPSINFRLRFLNYAGQAGQGLIKSLVLSLSKDAQVERGNKDGSILLLILLIAMVVLLAVTVVWQTTAHVVDLACVYEQREQRYHAAKALMRVAVSLAAEDFYRLQHEPAPVVINIAQWPPDNVGKLKERYQGTITFTQQKENKFALRVALKDKKTTVAAISCLLARRETEKAVEFCVSAWKNE